MRERWVEDLADFHRAAASMSLRHPRRLGLIAIQTGMTILFAGIPLSQVVMHVGLSLAAVGVALARPPLHRMPGFLCAVAFSAWIAGSVLFSGFLRADAPPWKLSMAVGSWLALYGAAVAFYTDATRRFAMRAAALTLCAAALLAVLQFTIGWGNVRPFRIAPSGKSFGRVSGFFGGGLTLGLMAACMGLAYCRRSAAASIGRGLSVSASLAALVAVALGFSRMAWIALASGLGAGITAARPRRFPIAIATSCAVTALGAACMLWVPFGSKMFDPGSEGRWIIWRISTGIAAAYPVLGAGGGQAFQALYTRQWHELDATEHFIPSEPVMPHAHNSFLAIAAEYGIPAMVLFMLFLAIVLRALYRLRGEDRDAWSSGAALFVAWVVAGQFNDVAGQSETAYVFFAAFGMSLAAAASKRAPVLPA